MTSVLIVAGKLVIGGAERVCRNIGYYADPSRFRIDYLVFGDEIGSYEADLLAKGCKIYHWQTPGAGYWRYYRQLVRLMREKQYDVVHCHTMFNSGIVLLAAKRCGIPIRIAHSHSIRGPEHRGLVKTSYEAMMRRWILRYATHCIGCGQAAGNWLFGEASFQKRGIVLLNGIELEQFRFDPRIREKLREKHQLTGRIVIGHVGHLAAVKNQIFLLRLLPELLSRQPDAHLILLGEGGDRAMLEQEIRRLQIEKAVTMTGNVSNVNEYLSLMDVFIFPSLYEGMPLAVVEAQANGLPCIISDRVPRDVYLTDLVQPLPLDCDQSDWIQAVINAKRADPEASLRQLCQSGFDLYNMLDKLYTIYQGTMT